MIFLDELDGLAPARAVREGGADQTYASLVSTLLSLMDGLHDRGHVIVIGATNRSGASFFARICRLASVPIQPVLHALKEQACSKICP